MSFYAKEYLYLLLLLIPYVAWFIWTRRRQHTPMRFSDIRAFAGVKTSVRVWLLPVLPLFLRTVSITLLILILARPHYTNSWQTHHTEGIDIMLAIDISTSMLSQDLKPNRLEAARSVAADFINGRPNDNIGLTLFSGAAFTPVPLTLDHTILQQQISRMQAGMIEDGTAIGMGMATAINHIKDRETKSRTIILLTDGTNNMGDISPLTAADIANSLGIRVYTISVGTHGMARSPVSTPAGVQYLNVPVEIDDKTLSQIAANTGGQHYRATSTSKLRDIYSDIDKLERTKMTMQTYHEREEAYAPFAIALLITLLLESMLRLTLFRTIND